MKTQDQPIAHLFHWYLELEDRKEAFPAVTEQTPVALRPQVEDGPICVEHLNTYFDPDFTWVGAVR